MHNYVYSNFEMETFAWFPQTLQNILLRVFHDLFINSVDERSDKIKETS